MEQKQRCQSCGMPLGDSFYGTEETGAPTFDYCKFCYQRGEFTEPGMTLPEMIKRSVENMTHDLNFPPERAKNLAEEVIPELKRWKK